MADPQRREDAEEVCDLMREVTGVEPVMWGPSIIGFGTYHYRYESGREGDWPAVGPLTPQAEPHGVRLGGVRRAPSPAGPVGPAHTGKSCLYVRRLSDVDTDVLRALIRAGFEHLNGRTVTSAPD